MPKLRQAGFMLIELTLAFALASIVLLYQVKQERDKLVESFGEAQGRQMKAVADASNAYAVTYYSEVLNNTPVAGVTTVRQPTVAELATLGFLPAGYGSQTMFGGGYSIVLTLSPTGCVLPDCNISGYVHTTQPILVDAAVSAKAIGKALAVIGPDGGAAQLTGATINGLNGGWSMSNPVAGQPRGVMAVRLGADSMAFMQFLRRDGTLPMTGDLDMGGQSISNAAMMAFSAAQTVGNPCTTGQVGRDANGELMACVSGAWKQAGGGKWKDPVASFAAMPLCDAAASGDVRIALVPSTGTGPRPYMCNGAGAWQALVLDDTGNISIPGTATIDKLAGNLEVTATAVEGAVCSPNGRIARDANGLLLSCQSGVWKKATGSASAFTEVNIALPLPPLILSSGYLRRYSQSVNVDAYGVPSSATVIQITARVRSAGTSNNSAAWYSAPGNYICASSWNYEGTLYMGCGASRLIQIPLSRVITYGADLQQSSLQGEFVITGYM